MPTKTMAEMPGEYSSPKNVSIIKADNGFVVSCYDSKGEKKVIAKDIEEASTAAEKMFGFSEPKESFKNVKEKANKLAMKKK